MNLQLRNVALSPYAVLHWSQMARKAILCISWLVAVVPGCVALLCNVCDGVDSLDRCQGVEECAEFAHDPASSQICQNDYRVVNNKITMRKKCKPRGACLTEEKMSDNNCDENSGRNTVCRCCCDTDKCNSQKKGCYFPSDCNAPPRPANGFVRCPPRMGAGARCSFGCNKGYKLGGIKSIQCGRNRESGVLVWKPPPTSFCVKEVIRCKPRHRKPKFGRMTCKNTGKFKNEEDRNYAGSVCTFECMEKYMLKGLKLSRCRRNKQWSSKTPICVRGACAKTPAVANGFANCTEGKLVGSECDFQCDRSYELLGRSKIFCEFNAGMKFGGNWSDAAPECKAITCGPVENPRDGNMKCTTHRSAGSRCSFSCNDGFDLDDTSAETAELKCSPSADGGTWEWTGVAPRCSPIKCEGFGKPEHGVVTCTNGNFKNSVCNFKCDDGYYIEHYYIANVTVLNLECVDDGDGDAVASWTRPLPPCKPIMCDSIEEASFNGVLSCTNKNFANSVCRFFCNTDYDLDGTVAAFVELKCVDDGDGTAKGLWSGPIPTCSATMCGIVQDPANGSVSCTNGGLLGSVCTFSCNVGYDMDNTKSKIKTITCTKNGVAEWSGSEPTCSAITCSPEQSSPRNGTVSCSNANFAKSVCIFTCNKGFEIDRKRSKRVKVTCLDGGEGDAVGKWTGIPPICSAVTCKPVLKNPRYGFVSCSNQNFVGSVCNFHCDDGYDLDETTDATFQVSCVGSGDDSTVGKWSGPSPTCSTITCPAVGEKITKGSVDCTDSNFKGSTCTFSCDSGFSINASEGGVAVIKCIDDGGGKRQGTWSGPMPKCSPITCNPPQSDPVNGFVKCNNDNFLNSVCRFKCDAGYKLHGMRRKVIAAKCLGDAEEDSEGKWSRTAPTCSPLVCLPIQTNPSNGFVECTRKNFVESVCTFTCNAGFTLSGTTDESLKVRCADDGGDGSVTNWNASAPVCSIVKCTPVSAAPDHGSVTCTDGDLENSVCTFSCDPGYHMDSNERAIFEITCLNGGDGLGKWSGSTPTCSPITCEAPRIPKYVSVVCTDENFIGSICTFNCIKGLFLRKEAMVETRLTCVVDENGGTKGKWVGNVPRCHPGEVTCETPRRPKDGNMNCTDGRKLNSVCTYSCKKGFVFDNTVELSVESTCEENGDGNTGGKWSSVQGKCIPIRCKPAHKQPENGRVICTNSNNVGSSCVFLCNTNYDMNNTTEASWVSNCEDDGDRDSRGRWSHPPGSCTLRRCYPTHSNPENGLVSCTNENIVKSVCIFTCDSGYQLMGKVKSACVDRKKDGDEIAEWNREAPTCSKGACDEPSFDTDTVARDCGHSDGPGRKIVGTECAYACKYTGYYLTLSGSQHMHIRDGRLVAKCLADNSWTTPPPGCSPVTCHPVLTAPIFGYPPHCKNTNKFRSVCNFSCVEGYAPTHKYPLTCRSNGNNAKYGRWDNAIPTCVRFICPAFRELSHGAIEYSDGTRIGSVAQLMCSAGYTPKEYENTTCVGPGGEHRLPYWKNYRYLCCVKCLRNSDLKFVAVLDKTAAHDNAEWRELLQFVEIALQEMRSNGFKVNFGLVLYGEEVDVSHSLPLTNTDEFKNLNVIIEEIKELPYGGDDSNTGQALVYANEVMFPTDTKEEPYLMLAMGGKSNDEVTEAAKKIREKDINVLALNIKSTGDDQFVDKNYLMGITGKEENIFTIGSSKDLQRVQKRIRQIAMQRGCSAKSLNQPCAE